MVKVILTGATGHAGSYVLERCLASPEVTKVVVLTRSALPTKYDDQSKIEVIVHNDFMSYPPDVVESCKGAVACLWALGLRGAPFGYPDMTVANKIDVDFPFAAAMTFSKALVGQTENNVPFRFVLLSGIGSEIDQTKKPFGMRDTRLLKGRIEGKLHELAERTVGFEAYTCRPFGIVEDHAPLVKRLVFSVLASVQATELAATMLHLGLNGNNNWILENADIKTQGKQHLQNETSKA